MEKKNSEYVGVDEKFIPEKETYVKPQSQTTKKAIKFGLGLGMLLVLAIIIGMVIFTATIMKKGQKEFSQFKEQSEQEHQNAIEDAEKLKEQMLNETNKTSFNAFYKSCVGIDKGFFIKTDIDTISKKNQTEDRKVTVIYQGESFVEATELYSLKSKLDDSIEYNITIEYDDNGYANKLNIENLK